MSKLINQNDNHTFLHHNYTSSEILLLVDEDTRVLSRNAMEEYLYQFADINRKISHRDVSVIVDEISLIDFRRQYFNITAQRLLDICQYLSVRVRLIVLCEREIEAAAAKRDFVRVDMLHECLKQHREVFRNLLHVRTRQIEFERS